jgi:aspartyl-tRNA synthetase
VKAIVAPNSADKPRGWFDKLNAWARENGQKGLGYIIFNDNEAKGPIAGNLKAENLKKILDISDLENGNSLFFICDQPKNAEKFASLARNKLCDDLSLLKTGTFEFCWIIDYPMFELDDKGKLDFSHNPFSMPQGGMHALNNQDP